MSVVLSASTSTALRSSRSKRLIVSNVLPSTSPQARPARRALKRYRHEEASEELMRTDAYDRQVFLSAEVNQYRAILYYLPEDDSFVLYYRLPDGSSEKAYINPDEAFFSYRYCLEILTTYAEAYGSELFSVSAPQKADKPGSAADGLEH